MLDAKNRLASPAARSFASMMLLAAREHGALPGFEGYYVATQMTIAYVNDKWAELPVSMIAIDDAFYYLNMRYEIGDMIRLMKRTARGK